MHKGFTAVFFFGVTSGRTDAPYVHMVAPCCQGVEFHVGVSLFAFRRTSAPRCAQVLQDAVCDRLCDAACWGLRISTLGWWPLDAR